MGCVPQCLFSLFDKLILYQKLFSTILLCKMIIITVIIAFFYYFVELPFSALHQY